MPLLARSRRARADRAPAIERAIEGIAHGYARALERMIPHGWIVLASAAVLVTASVWVAPRLPSAFFPRIDESMETVYVRLAPGTSLERRVHDIDAMGNALKAELPQGEVELVLTNVGSPMNARARWRARTGARTWASSSSQLSDADDRKVSQDDLAARCARSSTAEFPGDDSC